MNPLLHQLRRAAVLVTAAAAVSATAVVVAPAQAQAQAQAQARDASAAASSSAWLGAQLDGRGTYPNPFNPDIADAGLMTDAVYAMHASGDAALAQPILRYLDDQEKARLFYTSGQFLFDCDNPDNPAPTVAESDTDTWFTGGATAKTLLVALVSGRNPRDFGGADLVAATQGAISTDPKSLGKVRDHTTTESCKDFVSDSANTFGQILTVIALAALRQNDQTAIDTLLTQQCSEGYFRIFYYYRPDGFLNTCDEGKSVGQSAQDGDTTGFALSALLAAREAGATGLDDEIQRTVDWLVDHQDAGGGWGGGVGTEAPNTNSTGLVVQALAEAGAPAGVIADGEAYLRSAQVTAAADSGNSLSGQVGAIAYTPADYQAARTDGIAGVDTWIRAGAQASLGLSQVAFSDLAKGPLALTAPSAYVAAGGTVALRLGRLARGERYTVSIGGRPAATFVAGADGAATRSVRVPAGLTTRTHPVVVSGPTPNRVAASTVRVLGAKRLAVRVAKVQVKPRGKQTVVVRGLAAGERATIRVGGKVVRATAPRNGVVRRVLTVRKAAGKVTVRVTGLSHARKGSATFRIRR